MSSTEGYTNGEVKGAPSSLPVSTSLGSISLMDSSRLSCSVIVPVCHGGSKFEACLRSIASALSERDELIVVADGEGDGSWSLANRYGAQIINLPRSRGPGRARNAGARASNCDILFFVDADVIIPPDAICRIRTVLETDKDLAALIGSYDDEPAERNFHSQFKNLFHHFVHQKASEEASTFWGACGAIRREVFLGAGGYDETYERPCIEDIELGYRLKAAAHRIRLLPDLQVKHLKRWSAQSLIKTDMLDRAAPWTELIWHHFTHQKPRVLNDLNLSFSYRVSLVTSFLLMGALIGAFFTAWSIPLVLILGTVFIALQIPFVRFFRTKRGRRFAARALAWRFGYDIYSGLGFCYGSFRFANASTRKILSEAFAKLDAVALGMGVGSVGGSAVCAATLILLLKGGNTVGPNLTLLGQFFPAYGVTWRGSVIGLIDGFVFGYIFGFSVACVRNTAMRVHLGSRKVQRFLLRVRQQ